MAAKFGIFKFLCNMQLFEPVKYLAGKFACKISKQNFQAYNDHRKMKYSSLELSYQDKSNGSNYMPLDVIYRSKNYVLYALLQECRSVGMFQIVIDL